MCWYVTPRLLKRAAIETRMLIAETKERKLWLRKEREREPLAQMKMKNKRKPELRSPN